MKNSTKSLKIYNSSDFPKYLPKLNALYDDLFSGGKGFRSRLVQLVAHPIGLDEKAIHLLAQTIEFIHNASLLHDDLIDRSHLRRNKTTAWLKYTPEYAVLAGDYLLARVMVNLSSFGNVQLIQYTAQIISDLLEGEWIQDSLVNEWNVSPDQLDQVHNLKTASLFKWCLLSPFIAKGSQDKEIHHLIDELGGILGILFQRSDDLLDFDIRNYEKKAILGDLKSGYINSFGAFLIRDKNEELRKEFRNCQTLDEITQALGEGYFEQKLQEFDRLNEDLIELYFHYLDQLEEKISSEQEPLIRNLKELPNPLYWRKK